MLSWLKLGSKGNSSSDASASASSSPRSAPRPAEASKDDSSGAGSSLKELYKRTVASSSSVIRFGISFRNRLNLLGKGDSKPSSFSPVLTDEGLMRRSNSVSGVGSFSDVGRMNENQDEYISIENFCSDASQFLFGVFDGHGSFGGEVSKWIREMLPFHVQQQPVFSFTYPRTDDAKEWRSVSESLIEAFVKADEELLDADRSNIDTELSGCTATVAIIRGIDLYVAHVGDSRVVLGRQGPDGAMEAIALTEDHSGEVPEEKKRIEASGGRIIQKTNRNGEGIGPPRVYHSEIRFPGLAVTRAMGDKFAKTLGVSAEPDVLHRRLDPADKFVILSSDGVWGAMSNEEAVEVVAKFTDPQQASEALTQKALDQLDGSFKRDNITVVVVYLTAPDVAPRTSPSPSPPASASPTHAPAAPAEHAHGPIHPLSGLPRRSREGPSPRPERTPLPTPILENGLLSGSPQHVPVHHHSHHGHHHGPRLSAGNPLGHTPLNAPAHAPAPSPAPPPAGGGGASVVQLGASLLAVSLGGEAQEAPGPAAPACPLFPPSPAEPKINIRADSSGIATPKSRGSSLTDLTSLSNPPPEAPAFHAGATSPKRIARIALHGSA